MSETIFLTTAIYASSLLMVGLLLTMWEFSRLNRREHQQVGKVRRAQRVRTQGTSVYVPGYSGA